MHQAIAYSLVVPPAPHPVCPLLRPALLELLVPGRTATVDSSRPPDPTRAERIAVCEIERAPSAAGTDRVTMAVVVLRSGREGLIGPMAVTGERLSDASVSNREWHPLPALGDGAGRWSETGPYGAVYLFAGSGTRLVHVYYRNTGVSPQQRVEAATLAAREVLATL